MDSLYLDRFATTIRNVRSRWHSRRSSGAWLAVFGLVSLTGCQAAEGPLAPVPDNAVGALTACPAPDTTTYYFGDEAGQSGRGLTGGWFAPLLRSAALPSLSCGPQPESYRLVWMAWSRPAYVIAIARQGDGWRLGAVEFVDPRQHGFPPPKLPPIARQTERMLTRNEVDTLRPALAEAGIWSIPRFFDSGADDGWALLIEARVGSGYRTVMRVNVNDDRILGLFHAAIGLTPFTMPVQVARGASGYGTSRVDPWATLQHKTAWIHLGLRDRRTRKWMTTMDFMTLGNQDLREPPIPEPGQPIKLTRLMPLTLLGHGNTGETRRLESPADKQLSDADEIEAALAPGDEVLIEEISLDKKGDLQSVWARVSPRL